MRRGFFGWGCGRGGGRGGWRWRNLFHATGLTGWQRAADTAAGTVPADTQQQLDALNAKAEQFQTALDDIRKQLEELRSR